MITNYLNYVCCIRFNIVDLITIKMLISNMHTKVFPGNAESLRQTFDCSLVTWKQSDFLNIKHSEVMSLVSRCEAQQTSLVRHDQIAIYYHLTEN